MDRGKQETDLIFEFEQEHGAEENWSYEVRRDFEQRWNEIQEFYK